jgi:hypothetical protein
MRLFPLYVKFSVSYLHWKQLQWCFIHNGYRFKYCKWADQSVCMDLSLTITRRFQQLRSFIVCISERLHSFQNDKNLWGKVTCLSLNAFVKRNASYWTVRFLALADSCLPTPQQGVASSHLLLNWGWGTLECRADLRKQVCPQGDEYRLIDVMFASVTGECVIS